MLVGGPADCRLAPAPTDGVPEPKVSEWRGKTWLAKVGSETGKPRGGHAMLLATEATASTLGALKY